MADPNSSGSSHDNQNHVADANNDSKGYQNGASLIDMFKEICGVADDEMATELLRESGGNLEAAIHQFFYTNDNPIEPEMLENENNAHQELRQRRVIGAEMEAPLPPPINNPPNYLIPQRPIMTWRNWFRSLVFLPFRFFYSTFAECLNFFYHLIIGPPNQRNIANRNRRAIQRNQEQNLIQDRLLMRAQENEYTQALAIDRKRAQERKAQEQQKREEENNAKKEAERLIVRAGRIKQKREEITKNMQQEPEMTAEGIVRIRVLFPNGLKMERRFQKVDSLERLFEAVFIHSECPDDFSLLTSYPSNLLHCAPDWYMMEFERDKMDEPIKTFADKGLLTSAVIIVQDNDA